MQRCHWILRDECTRLGTLRAVHGRLKEGGGFVFEMRWGARGRGRGGWGWC